MLADAPLSNGPADVYRTVNELTSKTPERRKRRKHHKKKLRPEQRANGRKKRKGHGKPKIYLLKNISGRPLECD